MGAALFIVPERTVEGLETFVNGKALGHSEELDQLAEQAGVRPLMTFFSETPDQLEEFPEGEGIDAHACEPSTERWFAAADGLLTIRGMLGYLSANPESLKDGPALMEDLKEFEALLDRLDAEGIRWHLSVDF